MADSDRRGFLKFGFHCLNGLFALILGVPAAAYLVDSRNRKGSGSNLLPVDGVDLAKFRTLPRGSVDQGVVRAVREDAWTLHPNDVLGRVWVVKIGAGAEDKDIMVFTTECPHLGCSINHTGTTDQMGPNFTCPCHDARFTLHGQKIEEPGYLNAAPRGMDSLTWKGDEKDPKVLRVDFKKFIQGEPTKIEA